MSSKKGAFPPRAAQAIIRLQEVFLVAKPISLRITGARQNNLKNINLEIPHARLTVITGVSGSGKSSLAFDTLFAEGQWRYIESLSTYARMFLDRLHPPPGGRTEAN